jgi:F-type H+-transporting ATPase subunit alpha
MAFRPEEVSAILQKEIEGHQSSLQLESRGYVLQVGDGIARVWGLKDAQAGELLKFPGDVMGLVLNLEEDNIGCALFGSDVGIKEGDTVVRTGRIAEVPVGDAWPAASSTRSASPSTARDRSPPSAPGSSNRTRRAWSIASR